MKPTDELGLFWLPGHEDDALSGRLLFDPAEGSITLTLVGTFDHAADSDGQPDGRIVGWLGSDRITLDRVFSLGNNVRAPGVAESRYYANQMFLGHQFEGDESDPLRFRTVWVTFRDLASWVNRSGITETPKLPSSAEESPTYAMAFTPLEKEEADFSRGRITLGFAWQPSGDSIHGVTFKQWPVMSVVYDEMQALETISEDIERIQSLVTLCIDAPTVIDKITLGRPDIKVRMLDGSTKDFEQPIELIRPWLNYVDPDKYKPRYPHTMLLTYDELGGVAAVAQWVDISQRFERALYSLMSIKNAKHIFVENRFLNVTFAAEAFHRLTADAKYIADEEFRQLLDSYVAITPSAHRDWLMGRIGYGNEPPLRKRLQQLAGQAGPALRPLIGEKGRWAHTVAHVRNELTHVGENAKDFEGGDLSYLAESVYAVTRICMLFHAGVPMEILAEKAASYSQTWYGSRLKASIENARRTLFDREA